MAYTRNIDKIKIILSKKRDTFLIGDVMAKCSEEWSTAQPRNMEIGDIKYYNIIILCHRAMLRGVENGSAEKHCILFDW